MDEIDREMLAWMKANAMGHVWSHGFRRGFLWGLCLAAGLGNLVAWWWSQ